MVSDHEVALDFENHIRNTIRVLKEKIVEFEELLDQKDNSDNKEVA